MKHLIPAIALCLFVWGCEQPQHDTLNKSAQIEIYFESLSSWEVFAFISSVRPIVHEPYHIFTENGKTVTATGIESREIRTMQADTVLIDPDVLYELSLDQAIGGQDFVNITIIHQGDTVVNWGEMGGSVRFSINQIE